MSSGIYQIRNLVNNRIYIGSSKRLEHRKETHFSDLKLNRHHSRYLQRAYNKYREENFVFEILITCDPSMLIWYEQQFLDQWKPEYNINPNAKNCLGRKFTAETINKLRESHMGHKHTDEQKIKFSLARKGHTVSEETRKKIGAKHRGKYVSPGTRLKISKAGLGRVYSDERNKRIGDAHRGLPLSDLRKQRISIALRNSNNVGKTYPGVISPDGTIYTEIQNMSKFCREHELCHVSLRRVITGEFKQHKGWMKLELEEDLT